MYDDYSHSNSISGYFHLFAFERTQGNTTALAREKTLGFAVMTIYV